MLSAKKYGVIPIIVLRLNKVCIMKLLNIKEIQLAFRFFQQKFDYLIKHLLFVQKKFAIDIQKLIGAKKFAIYS